MLLVSIHVPLLMTWFSYQQVAAEKPNPTIFIKACELLGVKPEDAVHVGDDRRNDLWGARDAGCDAWLWGSDVHSFKEVCSELLIRLPLGWVFLIIPSLFFFFWDKTNVSHILIDEPCHLLIEILPTTFPLSSLDNFNYVRLDLGFYLLFYSFNNTIFKRPEYDI